LQAQIQAERKAATAQTERDTAAELLAAKEKEGRLSQSLVARLQELCRELHKQNKQARLALRLFWLYPHAIHWEFVGKMMHERA
jgi:uncharacterized protein YcbK (DUF882 family)